MQLTSAVRIGRPAPEVLDALLDAGKVAACLPGSRLIGEVDEGTYAGEIQLRIGPVNAVYAGTVHLDAADRAAGTARLRATGQERSGQGSADASVTLRVEPQGASTRVLISADLMIRGTVAQYAAGAIGDVGQRLVEQFAGNVERLLASQATTTATGGGGAPGVPALASPAGAAEPAAGQRAAGQPAAGQRAAGRPGRPAGPGPACSGRPPSSARPPRPRRCWPRARWPACWPPGPRGAAATRRIWHRTWRRTPGLAVPRYPSPEGARHG